MGPFEHIRPADINAKHRDTIMEVLGIEFIDVEDGCLRARMPVDKRTHQPKGLLHGGASVVLAETIGSTASALLIDWDTQYCVGLEVNANHLRPVRSGYVIAKAIPVHVGRTTHLWDIRITNEAGKLVCISRLTMAVRMIDEKPEAFKQS